MQIMIPYYIKLIDKRNVIQRNEPGQRPTVKPCAEKKAPLRGDPYRSI